MPSRNLREDRRKSRRRGKENRMMMPQITETKEWHEDRRKGIGGSDSPVILGVSPFKSPYDLWREKIGEVEPTEPTPPMLRGKYLEPIIAQIYQERTGHALKVVDEPLVHSHVEVMRANVDRLIEADDLPGQGVLEIKAPGLKVFSKIKREGVPDYYLVQLQHYLEVADLDWGAFAILNAERWEMLSFTVERDRELGQAIAGECADFWERYVVPGVPPEETLDLSEAAKMIPAPEDGVRIIHLDSDEWARAVAELREAREILEVAKELENDAKATITAMMGDLEAVEGGGARIYYRRQAGRKTLDTKRLKAELPEIYERYVKPGKTTRVFRPYFLDGE